MSTQYQLETLFQPTNPNDAEVDVILVDGFFGRKEDWAEFWIHGLKTEIPNALILKFGYRPGLVQSDSIEVTYEQTKKYTADLATSLSDNRGREAVNNRRPILFVTRSLSGLVCIQLALGDPSPDSDSFKQIATRARGVLVLEAPFRGSFTMEPIGGSNQKITVLVDPISLHELKEGGNELKRVMTALKKLARIDRDDSDRSERISIQNFENHVINQAAMSIVVENQSNNFASPNS